MGPWTFCRRSSSQFHRIRLGEVMACPQTFVDRRFMSLRILHTACRMGWDGLLGGILVPTERYSGIPMT